MNLKIKMKILLNTIQKTEWIIDYEVGNINTLASGELRLKSSSLHVFLRGNISAG